MDTFMLVQKASLDKEAMVMVSTADLGVLVTMAGLWLETR